MLLTSVLHVDENACRTTHISPDELRAMFETANARSPRCSMNRKKISQLDRDIVCWIIVQMHVGIMLFSSAKSNLEGLSSPYFGLLQLTFV